MGDAAYATSPSQSSRAARVIEKPFVPTKLLAKSHQPCSCHRCAHGLSYDPQDTHTEGYAELEFMGQMKGKLSTKTQWTWPWNVVAKSQDRVESVWGSP